MSLHDIGLETPYQLVPLPEFLPVLQQPKAYMTTNVPHSNKVVVVSPVGVSPVNETENTAVVDMSIRDLLQKVSSSFDDMVLEAYEKPKDVTVLQHIWIVCQKNERYFFIAILLLIFVFVMLFFESGK
jgi:hypothetical protein